MPTKLENLRKNRKRPQSIVSEPKLGIINRIWNKRTTIAWIIGVYAGIFGLASQKYENHRDRIDNKISILAAQLGTPARDAALSRVAEFQEEIRTPIEPIIYIPWTPFGV